MGFGDFLKAGASALGVDTDDIGGLFNQAKSLAGGDTGDIIGSAARQFGIDPGAAASGVGSVFGKDADDAVASIGSFFGGGGSTGGSGGGFGGVVGNLLGGGDFGGVAETFLGGSGFGAIFGGDGGAIIKSVSEYLPASVTSALADAGDLPFVQNAASGNWAGLAGSVPGLNSALGSFNLTTNDLTNYVQTHALQAVDGGSGWSLGSMITDQGTEFLRQVAQPMDADAVWSSLPSFAQQAGVDLPSWANHLEPNSLLQQGGHFLADGGFVPPGTAGKTVEDPWSISEGLDDLHDLPAPTLMDLRSAVLPTHDTHVAGGLGAAHAPHDPSWDEFSGTPAAAAGANQVQDLHAQHDAGAIQNHETGYAQPDEPPPPAEQVAVAEELKGGLEGLDDGLFS